MQQCVGNPRNFSLFFANVLQRYVICFAVVLVYGNDRQHNETANAQAGKRIDQRPEDDMTKNKQDNKMTEHDSKYLDINRKQKDKRIQNKTKPQKVQETQEIQEQPGPGQHLELTGKQQVEKKAQNKRNPAM